MQLHELQDANKRAHLIREIDELAFFLGLEANTANANDLNAFFNALYTLREGIIGNDLILDDIKDDIIMLAYYLGSILTPDNAPFVSDSISTLYEIRELAA